jgi:hypothetical protein
MFAQRLRRHRPELALVTGIEEAFYFDPVAPTAAAVRRFEITMQRCEVAGELGMRAGSE